MPTVRWRTDGVVSQLYEGTGTKVVVTVLSELSTAGLGASLQHFVIFVVVAFLFLLLKYKYYFINPFKAAKKNQNLTQQRIKRK